jgi:hypothetical protein
MVVVGSVVVVVELVDLLVVGLVVVLVEVLDLLVVVGLVVEVVVEVVEVVAEVLVGATITAGESSVTFRKALPTLWWTSFCGASSMSGFWGTKKFKPK